MATLFKRRGIYYGSFYQDGKRKKRSLGTSRLVLAKRQLQALEQKLLERKIKPPEEDSDYPADLFWSEYRQWAEQNKRPRTLEIEEMFWRQFMDFAEPEMLGDVTVRRVEEFKEHQKGRGLKDQSINNALRTLGTIYNWAGKLRDKTDHPYFTGRNPFTAVRRYKLPKNPPRFLSTQEIDEVLEAAQNHGQYILWVFALGIYAGLRKSEIGHARWEWFDWDQRLIILTSYQWFELKDYETRTVPLAEKLARVLEPYRKNEGFLFFPERVDPPVHRYRYEFKRVFKTVAKEAGLPDLKPHDLRHTFGSQLAQAGVSLYKIQKWMGHSDFNTTQIYAHLQAYDEGINSF